MVKSARVSGATGAVRDEIDDIRMCVMLMSQWVPTSVASGGVSGMGRSYLYTRGIVAKAVGLTHCSSLSGKAQNLRQIRVIAF
jgi:hypothetical protein